MVICHGVEVWIERKSDGQRYTEYKAPAGSPAYTKDLNEVYIEAREGEHFVIKRRILPDFNFKHTTAVRTGYQVGNSDKDIFHKNSTRTAILNAGVGGHVTIVERERCFIDDEDLEISDERLSHMIDSCGTVVVCVRRGSIKKLSSPKYWTNAQRESTQYLAGSQEAMKGNRISHSTSVVPVEEVPQPMNKTKFEPAAGIAGMKTKFTFRARSAMSLRLLKIVDLDEEEAAQQARMSLAIEVASAVTDTTAAMMQPPAADAPATMVQCAPVKLQPTEPYQTIKGESRTATDEDPSEPRTTAMKRENTVAFEDEELSIVSARQMPGSQTSTIRGSQASATHAPTSTEAERERKKAQFRLRRREMELRREELELKKQDLAMEREELDMI